MSLEQKLCATAEPWLEEEKLPPVRAEALAALVRRRSRARWLRRAVATAATGAAAVAAAVFWPVMVSVASGTPWVGPYVARLAQTDQGAYWAEQKGYVVPVGRSATGQGYTLRVESVLADAARTEVYYTVEGPGLAAMTHRPRIEPEFNLRRPGSGWSGRSDLTDGRWVGSLTLPPLPLPVTQVTLRMTSVAGVQGNWPVSFLASRRELDAHTRSLAVGRRWQGEGYDLTVQRVLLAPTETVVEVAGAAGADGEGFAVRAAALAADGRDVPAHGAQFNWTDTGSIPVRYRYAFDRVDEQAATAVFRLTDVVRWRKGGPAIDLARSGIRVTYGQVWFELDSVQRGEGQAQVHLRVPRDGPKTWRAAADFRDWVLVDAAGTVHRQLGVAVSPDPQDPATSRLTVTFPGVAAAPLRLEAGKHAEPVPGPFTVEIPLR